MQWQTTGMITSREASSLFAADRPKSVHTMAEAAEPQPEPQRDLDSSERARTSADATPLVTCGNDTQADSHGPEEFAWGSRGRRFKSCQPDSGKLHVRGRIRRDPIPPLTA